jgi:hypothetical protein
VVLACIASAAQAVAQTAISADGVVESTSGGFKFPDGSIQTAAAVAGSAPVEDTGQTGCWDAAGATRTCAGTGEDGDTLAGVAWPTGRFTDNGDGTVTDDLTGLIWLKDAFCAASGKAWQLALTWVADFNGGSYACTDYTAGTFTDWRLPNFKELLSLWDYSQSTVPLPEGHPFINVQGASSYWSSTTLADSTTGAWALPLATPWTFRFNKADGYHVWPVRGGQ